MTTGVDGVGGVAAAGPAQPSALGQLDKNAFLKLLVAQLRFQNPMSPTDGKEYLAQSAQFAMVERLEEISQAQLEAGAWQRAVAADGMLGRSVTGQAADGSAAAGVVESVRLTAYGPSLVLDTGVELAVDAVEEVRVAPA